MGTLTRETSAAGPAPTRRLHPLMTRAEFARALRVDPTTVDAWRRDGLLSDPEDYVPLPAKPGARPSYRYRRSALDRITRAAP